MHMYQRILVPVDGSGASMVALAHAVGLAREQGAELRIINVVDDRILAPAVMEPTGEADVTYILRSLEADGKRMLEEAGSVARKAHVRADTAQISSRGRLVSDVILAEARKSKSDLIVMGTHGRRGLNRLLLGSDAERVLRESAVPLLLTRQNTVRRSSKPVKRKSVAAKTRLSRNQART